MALLNALEVQRAYEKGQTWTGLMRRSGPALTANVWADMSYAAGNPVANYYAATPLTSAKLASAVWNAAAANYNDAGSMGEKVNDAGSAANPWTEEIETGYTAEELLRLMAAALLGELSGAAGTTITIRDVNDTIDRVVATVTAEGNRTAVTLDAT